MTTLSRQRKMWGMETADHPTSCLESRPTAQTVRFAGEYINLSELAAVERLDHSYLSKIFAGVQRPSLQYAERIARGLGMSPLAFLTGLLEQQRYVRPIRAGKATRRTA